MTVWRKWWVWLIAVVVVGSVTTMTLIITQSKVADRAGCPSGYTSC